MQLAVEKQHRQTDHQRTVPPAQDSANMGPQKHFTITIQAGSLKTLLLKGVYFLSQILADTKCSKVITLTRADELVLIN